MKVTVYANWCEQEVINKAEYEERLKEHIDERFNDQEAFIEYLCNEISMEDIWKATSNASTRKHILEQWQQQCKEEIYDEDEYEEVSIEV